MKIFHKKNAKLTEIEKAIEEWIEKNTKKFLELSIKEVAHNYVFCSVSGITRYIQKIGYSSYREFRNEILVSFGKEKNYQDDPISSYIENINVYYLSSLEKTLKNLNRESLQTAI